MKVGQVWQDLDKRMGERKRKVVEVKDGKAKMTSLRDAFPTWVSIKRMYCHSTGWKLVEPIAQAEARHRMPLPPATGSAVCSLCGEATHKLSECPACLDNENTRRLLLTTRKALWKLLRHCDASPLDVEAAQQTLDVLKQPNARTELTRPAQ